MRNAMFAEDEETSVVAMDNLRVYINIVLKRLWLIALLLVITVGGIYYTASSRPPKYQTTVRLQILGVEPDAITLFTPVRQVPTAQQLDRIGADFINALRNRDVAWKSARQINKELGTHLTADDIIKVIWPWLDGEFIYVRIVEADTATLAKRMAEVHIENALAYYRTERARSVIVARQFIEQEVKKQEDVLAQTRDTLTKFRLRYNLADVDREIEALQDQIRALRLERDRAQVKAEQAESGARTYRHLAQTLRQQASSLSPDNVQHEALLSQAREYETRAGVQDAVVAGQQAAIRRYDRLINDYENRLAELIGIQEEYESLVHRVKQEEDQYAFLQSKLKEAQVKEDQALHSGYIQVVEAAHEPVRAAPRNIGRLVFYGAALALMIGVVLAFLLEFLSHLARRQTSMPSVSQERP